MDYRVYSSYHNLGLGLHALTARSSNKSEACHRAACKEQRWDCMIMSPIQQIHGWPAESASHVIC